MTEDPEKIKLLVIEDNTVNVQLLKVYLEGAGYAVLHAPDGRSGLEMAAAAPDIGAILLDRIMPDMDGLDALRALKASASTQRIPVIMTTAALSSSQVEEAELVGAYACLRKPYNKEKILAALEGALETKGDRRGR